MKNLWLVLALICAACGAIPPPVTPIPPSSTVQTAQRNVSIYDEAGSPVTDAVGTLVLDAEPSETPVTVTSAGWRQSFEFKMPPAHLGWSGTLTVKSPNYTTTAVRIPPVDAGAAELPTVTMKAAASYGDESGWLRMDGNHFVLDTGRTWRYRGYTSFTLLEKFCNGQDIGPLVEDAASTGARVFRTLGMYKGGLGSFTLAVSNPSAYDSCLRGYGSFMADRGYRIEFVVFADAQEIMPGFDQQREWLAHVAGIIGNQWNEFGELCNECEKNGVDPSRFSKPSTRILWSRGSGLGAGNPPSPGWDYTTYHEARDDEYFRKNECRPYMTDTGSPLFGIACVQDEPMGAAEVQQPGRRVGAVNGDPTQAILDFGQVGANFGINGPGGLFHSDAGLSGGLLGPVQRQMAVAFFKGLNFAPPEASRWTYQRGNNCGDCDGVGGMPLTQWDMPNPQGTVRTFCRGNGQTEWCVEHRRAGGTPQGRAGWRVVDQPFPGLIRLER